MYILRPENVTRRRPSSAPIHIATPRTLRRPMSFTPKPYVRRDQFAMLRPSSGMARLIQLSTRRLPSRPTVDMGARPIRPTLRPSLLPLADPGVLPVGPAPSPAAPSQQGIGSLGLGTIGSDLSTMGGDIVDKAKSFAPIAIKLGLAFIGIKILLWVLRGRR